MDQIPEQAQELLDFWFADSQDSYESFLELRQTWFTVSAEFDETIATRFEAMLVGALQGELADWERSSKSLLALIILNDQFPRNVFRGTPQAFAHDSEALRLALKMLDTKFDLTLSPLERMFAYMPFQHAEDFQIQQLSVKKFGELVKLETDPAMKEHARESENYAILHHDIIERFGRFPHRNEILGRESTDEERNYLDAGAETFGQQAK